MRNFPIRSVQIKDFKCHEDLKAAFSRGVTVIVGPNGKGKSSLMEAISWCLFGPTSVKASQERLVRKGANSCSVLVNLFVGGVLYEISRKYSSTDGVTARIYAGGEVLADKSTGVADFLSSLGVTKEGYDLIYAQQGELSFFVNATPAIRKALMTSLFRLDVLDEVISNIRADYRVYDSEIVTTMTSEEAKQAQKTLEIRIADRDIFLRNIADYENELEFVKGEIANRTELHHEKDAREQLLFQQGVLATKIIDVQLNIDELHKQLNALSEYEEEDFYYSINEIDNLSDQLEDIVEENLSIDIRLTELYQERDLLSKQIKTNVCPTCKQPLLDISVEEAKRFLITIKDDISVYEKNKKNLNKKFDEISEIRGKLIERKENLDSRRILGEELRKEYSRIEDLNDGALDIQKALEQYPPVDIEKLEQLQHQRDVLLTDISAATNQVNLLNRDIEHLNNKLEEYNLSLVESRIAAKKAAALEKLKKEFPNFRDVILAQSLEWVSNRASSLLNSCRVADTAWDVSIDTDLNFWINGIPLQDYSAGQIDLACVCIRIAITEFLSNRVGIKGLLILDGVFDSIDETNLDAVGRLVSEIAIDQVFVLSHFSVPIISEREIKL
jgi:exonuclease SbcC